MNINIYFVFLISITIGFSLKIGCLRKEKKQKKNLVTFDSLVMLLDASLEGELDDVIKYTKLVCMIIL